LVSVAPRHTYDMR